MSEPRTDQADLAPEPERDAAPDMLAELGPLAYGLLTLGQDGPLTQIPSLQQSRTAQIPAQSDSSPERDTRSEALLDEFGELDI
jgi:hypothetical protein